MVRPRLTFLLVAATLSAFTASSCGVGTGSAPSLSPSSFEQTPATTSPPTATPQPGLDVGVEALISGVPGDEDAWRVLVDSVSYGDDATRETAAGDLPELDNSMQWVRFRLQARYVGSGTVNADIAASDISLIYQRAGVDYVSQPLAGRPALTVPIEQDSDVALTFWAPISGEAAVAILAWDPFHTPGYVLQWPLNPGPSTAPTPDGTPPTPSAEPPTPEAWLVQTGQATDFPLGKNFNELRPEANYLVASWSKSEGAGCHLFITMESDQGASDSFIGKNSTTGIRVIKLDQVGAAADTSWTLNVVAGCDWQLALSNPESWFGPHGEEVARFIWSVGDLGPAWTLVIPDLSADANQARRVVDDLIATNPAARKRVNLTGRDWFARNNFVQRDPALARTAQYAILATALRDLLPENVHATLLAPFAEVIQE